MFPNENIQNDAIFKKARSIGRSVLAFDCGRRFLITMMDGRAKTTCKQSQPVLKTRVRENKRLTMITAQTLSAVRNPYESNNHCETNGKTAPPIPLPVQMTAKARPFLAINHSSMRYMAGKYRVTPPMPNTTPCVARRAPVVLVKDAAIKALVKIARPTRLARRLLFGNR